MSNFLSSRTWRKMERRALRAHDRHLKVHLSELVESDPEVIHVDANPAGGAVSLQLVGHRLLLAGVTPMTVGAVVDLERSDRDLRLARCGRYGRYWWIALRSCTGPDVIVLGVHLQLIHDRGHGSPFDTTMPADSEPSLV